MALATDFYFPTCAGTRRPILARFTSDNEVTTAGVVAVVTLEFYAAATAGLTFVAAFGGNTIIFTTTATPGHDTGTDFPTGTTSGSTIASYLDDNYLLAQHYDITNSGATVTLTAKLPGAGFTLAFSGGYTSWAVTASTAGVTEVRRPNFQAWADLYIEPTYGSNNFSLLAGKLAATRAADGGYYFDVSALLDAHVSDQPPTPGDIAIRDASEAMLVRYLVRVCEAFGTPIAPQGISIKGNRTALRGRNPLDAVGTAGNTLPTGTYSASGFMPLTGRPATKRVTRAQDEFLYLLNTGGSNWRLNATAHFTDGTSAGITPLLPATATLYRVWAIPMGYAQLGIGAINPAKTVRQYVVNIEMGWPTPSGDITYTFEVMDNCPPHIRYLLFRNEMGGWDTLQLHGALQRSGQHERSSGQRILPENYSLLTREAFDYGTASLDTYEAHTGYHLTEAEADWYLRQLLQSEDVRLYDGAQVIPINITTKEADYKRDRNPLYGMLLKFQRSQRHADRHTTYKI